MEDLLLVDGQDLRKSKTTEAASSAVAAEASITEVYMGAQAVTMAEVEQVHCECCGLAEDCTPSYIAQVRELYYGKWICGLCAEAVKEEYGRELNIKDALDAHMSICKQFNTPEKPRESSLSDLAAAMSRLMRKRIDGSSGPRSAPSSPRRGRSIARTNSLVAAFSRK